MATCAIWRISDRLDKVIDYTSNIDKTKKEDISDVKYTDLHKTLEYAKAGYKTEEQYYVSGINCDPDTAYEEMIATKEFFHKTGGIQGFHAFQSFQEGEVTPEEAHELGIRLAKELWGDRFQVLVSTHLNTNHLHNHFVLCSVSFVDGKRFYDTRETYAFMRHMNDEICSEFGLDVLEEKECKKSKINYSNYYKKYVQKNGYRATAKKDVDFAIRQAFSYKDFFTVMEKMGYEIYERYGRISVKKENHAPVRIERSFGDNYSIDRIKVRIREEQSARVPFMKNANKNYIPRTISLHRKSNIKIKGFMAIYFHYYYLFKRYKQNPMNYKLTPQMRADLIKMNIYSNEAKLLSKYNIQNSDDLLNLKQNKSKEIRDLSITREGLWYRRSKEKDEDKKVEFCNKIAELNSQIEELSKEVELCRDIQARIPKMKENLKEQKKFEDDERKQERENEYGRRKYFRNF